MKSAGEKCGLYTGKDGILLIIYVLSYTCISVTVSDHLHTLHLYLYLRYCICYLCFVLYMYFSDSNCICHLYLHYFIHHMNMFFSVQRVEHFVDIGH